MWLLIHTYILSTKNSERYLTHSTQTHTHTHNHRKSTSINMHENIVGVKNRISLMKNQFRYFSKWKWNLTDRKVRQVQFMGLQKLDRAEQPPHTYKIVCIQPYNNGLPRWLVVKAPYDNAGDIKDTGSILGLGRFPWRRVWQPTPLSLPGESYGQRSLVSYNL